MRIEFGSFDRRDLRLESRLRLVKQRAHSWIGLHQITKLGEPCDGLTSKGDEETCSGVVHEREQSAGFVRGSDDRLSRCSERIESSKVSLKNLLQELYDCEVVIHRLLIDNNLLIGKSTRSCMNFDAAEGLGEVVERHPHEILS